MAVGPIGNAIYVNQQMASVASEQTAQHNKFDLQNLAAAALINEKEKEVQAVRPTEEIHETNEDAERKKREEEENEKNKENAEKEKEEPLPPLHLLDIKV
jgi:DNA segregation ATPase FtsK/SpoIIIE-like protein